MQLEFTDLLSGLDSLSDIATINSGIEESQEVQAERHKLYEQGYPEWVTKRVTPNITEKAFTRNTQWKPWIDSRQKRSLPQYMSSGLHPHPTGYEIFATLLPDQKGYEPRYLDGINSCVNLTTLLSFDEEVPTWFYDPILFAWQSVVKDKESDHLFVPARRFRCRLNIVNILWFRLDVHLGNMHQALTISR